MVTDTDVALKDVRPVLFDERGVPFYGGPEQMIEFLNLIQANDPSARQLNIMAHKYAATMGHYIKEHKIYPGTDLFIRQWDESPSLALIVHVRDVMLGIWPVPLAEETTKGGGPKEREK